MFVDIIRGAAIFGVILVHSSVYGIWYSEPNALKVLPSAAVAALSPIILLGTWAGAFALITGLVNAYNIHRRVAGGRSLRTACAAPAVNAAVLMGIWVLVALLFTHRRHGIFGGEEVFSLISGSIALGRFTPPDLQTLFYKDALVMISLSGFTSALAMRLVYRRLDTGNPDHLRRAVFILLTSGALFLGVSSVLQKPLFALFGRLWDIGTPIALLAAWFVNLLCGPSHVLLPYGGFALIGCGLGVLTAWRPPVGTIRRFCLPFGAVYLAVSAVLILRTVTAALDRGEDPLVALFDYLLITPQLFFFAAGSLLLVFPAVIRATEYRPEKERSRLFARTVWIRRFGMISLSVFILENPLTALIGRIFHTLFGDPSAPVDPFMTNAPAVALYVVITFGLWFAIVRLWEKAGFRYSFEWLSITLGSRLRKDASNRLDVQRILYGRQTGGDGGR